SGLQQQRLLRDEPGQSVLRTVGGRAGNRSVSGVLANSVHGQSRLQKDHAAYGPEVPSGGTADHFLRNAVVLVRLRLGRRRRRGIARLLALLLHGLPLHVLDRRGRGGVGVGRSRFFLVRRGGGTARRDADRNLGILGLLGRLRGRARPLDRSRRRTLCR